MVYSMKYVITSRYSSCIEIGLYACASLASSTDMLEAQRSWINLSDQQLVYYESPVSSVA